jgi:hypothetical protein
VAAVVAVKKKKHATLRYATVTIKVVDQC